MKRYQWRTVTFICDPDSSQDYFFRNACREFPAILRAKNDNYYIVYDFNTKLSGEASRETALMKAKFQSRG
jgi:hypothetical protein